MLVVQITNFDPINSLDQILFVSMLHIWNLKYSKHFELLNI